MSLIGHPRFLNWGFNLLRANARPVTVGVTNEFRELGMRSVASWYKKQLTLAGDTAVMLPAFGPVRRAN